MRVNGRFLYAGIFLVALGAVLVASDLAAVDSSTLGDVLRLWPLVPIALGAGLVLRRSRYSLPSGMLAAALPGLLLGGAFAALPRSAGECGVRGEPVAAATEQGTFEGSANVSVRTGCGSLTIRTAPGSGWQVSGGNTSGGAPRVEATADSLSVRSAEEGSDLFVDGRESWDLMLPTSPIDELSLVAHANDSDLSLAGARIRRLAVTANVSEVVVDASQASLEDLSAVLNVGHLAIDLPSGSDVVGSVRLGGGTLRLCAPPELGLRVEFTGGVATRVMVGTERYRESEWQSPNFRSAAHRADLAVRGNFGVIEIDPTGGCK